MFSGAFPASSTDSVVVATVCVCVLDDGVLGGCVLKLFVLILFEVITMSLSDVWTVVGPAVDAVVDEYPSVTVLDVAVAAVFGSCVSTGSLTQEGAVVPSAADGL